MSAPIDAIEALNGFLLRKRADEPDAGYIEIHGFVLRAGLLPIAERASELRLSVSTLRRAISAGELAHVRIGDRTRIGPVHAADWLKSKEVSR